ncbi:unnamed protein product [Rhizopus microsporus]|uniref:Uncharacterized protein n=1 Tax=Rhizopus microsporus TaxID=58291 RepID=A0A0A1NFR5_RHIZD|nr:hypothetical protein BCV71DRAFT_267861 [Rhizopus microsporus]CEI95675.1 hypothetical protein RMCBS344292_09854 [Rhizopus microsporus]
MTKLTSSSITNQSRMKNWISLPVIVLFFVVFFFISSLRIKIIYTTTTITTTTASTIPSTGDEQVLLENKEAEPLAKHVTKPYPKPNSYPFTIVTASSANHLCSLENFLYSLYDLRSQFKPNEFPRIVVYNIGMNRTQLPILDQFVETGLVDDLVTFDYFKYPRFWDVAINAGEYAWKTGIVHEASEKYAENGILVWLDAGNIVTPEFIKSIPTVIRKGGGFWSPRSSKAMKDWTHPGMYEYFNADPKAYARNANCNGAAIGFDVSNKNVMKQLIEPWYQCGLDKNCIAPPGSSRENHRQDQAALTFLAYRAGFSCMKSPNYYKLQTHRDHSCRSELMALDLQEKLNHPSSIDYPKWYGSNTLQLYHHPEWRYPEDKVPEQLKRILNPPSTDQLVA